MKLHMAYTLWLIAAALLLTPADWSQLLAYAIVVGMWLVERKRSGWV